MSGRLFQLAWNLDGIHDPVDRIVLLTFADLADDRGRVDRLPVDRLAAKCRMDEEGVSECVARLLTIGLLWEAESDHYQIAVPELEYRDYFVTVATSGLPVDTMLACLEGALHYAQQASARFHGEDAPTEAVES